MDKQYVLPVRMSKLHDELAAAGVTPSLVEGDSGGTSLGTYVRIVAPQSVATVDAIVAAHNPNTPGATEQQASADTSLLADFRANLLAGAQLLGWTGDLRTGSFGANTGQWAALTPTQQTAFMRRVLMAAAVFGRRTS